MQPLTRKTEERQRRNDETIFIYATQKWESEYTFCQSAKDLQTASVEFADVSAELGFSPEFDELEYSERMDKLTKAYIECCAYPGRANIFPFDDLLNDSSLCVNKVQVN